MKNFKKMMAILIVAVMTLMYAVPLSFADTNNVTLDGSVSVSGLEAGDKVNFIQVIKWVDGSGWDYVDGLEAAATTAGVTLPTLTSITGTIDTSTTPATVTAGAISAEHAAVLAKAAVNLSGSPHQETASTSAGVTTATYTNAPAGLYYAQVVPATADYLYNTIFVGADFKSDNTTNTISAATARVGGDSAPAVAKKENVTLTKESNPNTAADANGADNIKYDHDLGEVIPFTITSKVPAYAAGYINPHYVITDVLEEGLTLCKSDGTAVAASDIRVAIEGVNNIAAGTDYTVEINGQTMTVTLTADGIAKVAALGEAKTITVTYNAKITSLDTNNVTVTEKTNTATVEFSNTPTDESSYSLLEDKTRHYTFSLDANLLGYDGTSYVTDELVKTGIGADGYPLTEKHEYHSGTTWSEQSPLQGAKFALFKESPAEADYANETAALASDKLYKNPGFTGIVTSDENGRLNITGLDAGTYYLREVSAPTGFIKDNRTFTITIDATYDTIAAGSYMKDVNNTPSDATDDVKVNYDSYKVLNGYTVKVNDGTNDVTSTYTIAKVATPVQEQKVDKATYQTVTGEGAGDFAGDVITPISNTQGTELPSTGGVGTTMFYLIGAILIIGAGVILVTRRRVNAREE